MTFRGKGNFIFGARGLSNTAPCGFGVTGQSQNGNRAAGLSLVALVGRKGEWRK